LWWERFSAAVDVYSKVPPSARAARRSAQPVSRTPRFAAAAKSTRVGKGPIRQQRHVAAKVAPVGNVLDHLEEQFRADKVKLPRRGGYRGTHQGLHGALRKDRSRIDARDKAMDRNPEMRVAPVRRRPEARHGAAMQRQQRRMQVDAAEPGGRDRCGRQDLVEMACDDQIRPQRLQHALSCRAVDRGDGRRRHPALQRGGAERADGAVAA
jgi:hypothetical protein